MDMQISIENKYEYSYTPTLIENMISTTIGGRGPTTYYVNIKLINDLGYDVTFNIPGANPSTYVVSGGSNKVVTYTTTTTTQIPITATASTTATILVNGENTYMYTPETTNRVSELRVSAEGSTGTGDIKIYTSTITVGNTYSYGILIMYTDPATGKVESKEIPAGGSAVITVTERKFDQGPSTAVTFTAYSIVTGEVVQLNYNSSYVLISSTELNRIINIQAIGSKYQFQV